MLNIQTLKCKNVENQNMFVWLVWNNSNQQLCVFSKNLIDLHKSWRNFSGLFLKCDKRFDKPILTHYAPVELQYWDLANFIIFRIFRINYQKMLRKKFWCCRCKSTEENRPNLKILIFFLQTKIYRVTQENETTIKIKCRAIFLKKVCEKTMAISWK